MPERTMHILTARGTMPVHMHEPAGGGDAPLVVLFMDAPGVRPALHGHAERLASAGYRVAIPDLYYDIDPSDRPNVDRLRAGDPEEFARMGAVVARLNDAEVIADTALMLTELRDDEPWGCVGFCMGGRFGLRAAQQFDDLAAVSLLHPSRLVTDEPDAPYRSVDRIEARLYFGFGERDHVTPVSDIPPIREQLEREGVSFEIDVIPGADHGFTMPGMPAYSEPAAEQAWAGTLGLLGERLPTTR
jgi:carboxymethylenebutenolidase